MRDLIAIIALALAVGGYFSSIFVNIAQSTEIQQLQTQVQALQHPHK